MIKGILVLLKFESGEGLKVSSFSLSRSCFCNCLLVRQPYLHFGATNGTSNKIFQEKLKFLHIKETF